MPLSHRSLTMARFMLYRPTICPLNVNHCRLIQVDAVRACDLLRSGYRRPIYTCTQTFSLAAWLLCLLVEQILGNIVYFTIIFALWNFYSDRVLLNWYFHFSAKSSSKVYDDVPFVQFSRYGSELVAEWSRTYQRWYRRQCRWNTDTPCSRGKATGHREFHPTATSSPIEYTPCTGALRTSLVTRTK